MAKELIRALEAGGEGAAAARVDKVVSKADARELAYRLYTLCKRKKRAAEALPWPTTASCRARPRLRGWQLRSLQP